MTFFSVLRGTAAGVTLTAGVFAAAVRFGPAVAPQHHEAAMATLAAAFGQDLDPFGDERHQSDPAMPAILR
ncbi:hypothetical protein [Tropicimonas sp. IMCC6043]|uniref:hypothetical protein n=1 Tax=Tropicimonas sp. IMCC6043 TaxID=2510645 RepID=UPI00101C4926|nr:hypothetical protein [Tropicimonas sp. IMCC6043]RYH10919.1 hypothetical protein EU800_06615 [Tropicimonas sp. IMCC6043]